MIWADIIPGNIVFDKYYLTRYHHHHQANHVDLLASDPEHDLQGLQIRPGEADMSPWAKYFRYLLIYASFLQAGSRHRSVLFYRLMSDHN